MSQQGCYNSRSRRDRGQHVRQILVQTQRRASRLSPVEELVWCLQHRFKHACILAVDAVSSLCSGEYGTADFATTPTSEGDCGT